MALPKAFNDLIEQSELPVLVDFWAAWCGPCKTVAPVVAEIAREFKGKLVVVKVNVDEKPQISAQYQIQSIPTLMIFHKGRVLARESGALPYPSMKQLVQQALAGN